MLSQAVRQQLRQNVEYDADAFEAVLTAFGPLPESWQAIFLSMLIMLRMDTWLAAKGREAGTATRMQKVLSKIAKSSDELVGSLYEFATHSLLRSRAGDDVPVFPEVPAATILKIVALGNAARDAAEWVERQKPKGRGGVRHRRSVNNTMMGQLIDLYASFRQKFPQSGRPPALGGPLERFIEKALVALASIKPAHPAYARAASLIGWSKPPKPGHEAIAHEIRAWLKAHPRRKINPNTRV